MPSLEIGSGDNPQPGYLHTDRYVDRAYKCPLDLVCDASFLPFRDGVFDSVLMFGVFEHFGIYECETVLLEVSRVVKKGGALKLDVPDFDWFVERYLFPEKRGGRGEEWILKSIFGGQDGPGQYHRWGWSESRIRRFLSDPKWGFSKILLTGRQWRDPEDNHLVFECIKLKI